MKNQVLSIEQMREFQALGIDTSIATCYWLIDYDFNCQFALAKGQDFVMKTPEDTHHEERLDAFTLHDILNLLPEKIERNSKEYGWVLMNDSIAYWCNGSVCVQFNGNLLNCARSLLKWCKQNNYI